ncbi:MAG: threonine--tRNA ligase [Verrucomicrobia bacterium]|nr:threonine--tRNA ligase [Verrucomicrobiota bacterium]
MSGAQSHSKSHDDNDMERYRHSVAHVMASAVKQLFPEAKLGFGPAIEDGFYYDFDVEAPFTPEILGQIESRMREVIAGNEPFERREVARAEAIELFRSRGEDLKVEHLEHDLLDGTVSLYQHGDFIDLCRGPHLERTGDINADGVMLLSIAGAYWKGDARNKMLQRIYGTAFRTKAELDAHIEKIEEAKKRDHRRLGRELDLYNTYDESGPGLIMWHPKGAKIRAIIEDFWRKEHDKAGYQYVYTPHIYRGELFQKSGHLEKYSEMMYNPMDIDGIDYYAKPMNCPGHILIYSSRGRSYRELPVRYCELGTVYRYEPSGTLHGLLRVRGFTQDDAHIFCTPEQLEDELVGVLDFVERMMGTFHYTFTRYLATRPEMSLGDDASWEMAENGLKQALKRRSSEYVLDEGGGVFYGPKVDYKLIDALGREWQGPTLQLDFNLPERFDMVYTASDGTRKRPVMLHRALLGSMERFTGGLIEHYAGAFPVWLAPVQARVMTVTDAQGEYARSVVKRLREAELRPELDDRNEKIGFKVREAQVEKVPYSVIVGDKEVAAGTVAVRKYHSKQTETCTVEDLVARLCREAASRELLVGGQ